jgi:hypothetical protein
MISGNVVRDLCRLGVLGECESSEAQALLRRLRPRGELSRRHWEEWNKVSDALDTASLACLVRGLVLTEETLTQWSSGSVSPVIWTFHALGRRSPEAAVTVAEWGRGRTTNSYIPFCRGATNFLDEAAGRIAREKEEQSQRTEAEQRKRERTRLAEERHAVALRKASERANFLQRLAGLPLQRRLHALFESPDRALSWFPEAWATEAIGAVGELAPELKDQLVKRLTGHRKGPWRRLREALMQTSSL